MSATYVWFEKDKTKLMTEPDYVINKTISHAWQKIIYLRLFGYL